MNLDKKTVANGTWAIQFFSSTGKFFGSIGNFFLDAKQERCQDFGNP